MKKTFALLISVLLPACFGDGSMLSTRGIIASDGTKVPNPYYPDPVYCYKSLGGVDCYTQQVPHLESRLVAFYPIRPSGVSVQEAVIDKRTRSIHQEGFFYHPPQDLIPGRQIVTPYKEVIKAERQQGHPLSSQFPMRIDQKPTSLKKR